MDHYIRSSIPHGTRVYDVSTDIAICLSTSTDDTRTSLAHEVYFYTSGKSIVIRRKGTETFDDLKKYIDAIISQYPEDGIYFVGYGDDTQFIDFFKDEIDIIDENLRSLVANAA